MSRLGQALLLGVCLNPRPGLSINSRLMRRLSWQGLVLDLFCRRMLCGLGGSAAPMTPRAPVVQVGPPKSNASPPMSRRPLRLLLLAHMPGHLTLDLSLHGLRQLAVLRNCPSGALGRLARRHPRLPYRCPHLVLGLVVFGDSGPCTQSGVWLSRHWQAVEGSQKPAHYQVASGSQSPVVIAAVRPASAVDCRVHMEVSTLRAWPAHGRLS